MFVYVVLTFHSSRWIYSIPTDLRGMDRKARDLLACFGPDMYGDVEYLQAIPIRFCNIRHGKARLGQRSDRSACGSDYIWDIESGDQIFSSAAMPASNTRHYLSGHVCDAVSTKP